MKTHYVFKVASALTDLKWQVLAMIADDWVWDTRDYPHGNGVASHCTNACHKHRVSLASKHWPLDPLLCVCGCGVAP